MENKIKTLEEKINALENRINDLEEHCIKFSSSTKYSGAYQSSSINSNSLNVSSKI